MVYMDECWGLEPPIARAFYGQFQQLNPMQTQVIAPLLAGSHVILSAATGAGKTQAVLAPLLSRYWSQFVSHPALFLLYIVPTRALANDLLKRLYQPCAALSIKLGIRHGEHNDLPKNPHLLITTPESLDVLLIHQPQAVQHVQAVIVDEAHLFYNTQRGLQLAVLLQRLKQHNKAIQQVALSATLTSPEGFQSFLFGCDAVVQHWAFSSQRHIDGQIRSVRHDHDWVALVSRLVVGRPAKLLVFAPTRQECDRLAQLLQTESALKGCVWVHHSALAPTIRHQAEQRFAAASSGICIATSTLELGIDIGDIDAVVLWEPPENAAAFWQRIGRSNRRQQKTNVICLVPTGETFRQFTQVFTFVALLESAQKGVLPAQPPQLLYGALGQQVCSILASQKGQFISVQQWLSYFAGFTWLDRTTLVNILDELVQAGLLQRHAWKNSYAAQEALWERLDRRQIYSNFAEESVPVDVWHGSQSVGQIPGQNVRGLEPGQQIRFGGKLWQIQKIRWDGIHVQKAGTATDVVNIRYPKRLSRLDPWLLQQTWEALLTEGPSPWLHQQVAHQWMAFRQTISFNRHHLLCQVEVAEDSGETRYGYYTFAGYWLNRAVALWSGQSGFKSDDFCLQTNQPIDWAGLPETPDGFADIYAALFEFLPDRSLFQQWLPFELQLEEFISQYFSDPVLNHILLRLRQAEVKKSFNLL